MLANRESHTIIDDSLDIHKDLQSAAADWVCTQDFNRPQSAHPVHEVCILGCQDVFVHSHAISASWESSMLLCRYHIFNHPELKVPMELIVSSLFPSSCHTFFLFVSFSTKTAGIKALLIFLFILLEFLASRSKGNRRYWKKSILNSSVVISRLDYAQFHAHRMPKPRLWGIVLIRDIYRKHLKIVIFEHLLFIISFVLWPLTFSVRGMYIALG